MYYFYVTTKVSANSLRFLIQYTFNSERGNVSTESLAVVSGFLGFLEGFRTCDID